MDGVCPGLRHRDRPPALGGLRGASTSKRPLDAPNEETDSVFEEIAAIPAEQGDARQCRSSNLEPDQARVDRPAIKGIKALRRHRRAHRSRRQPSRAILKHVLIDAISICWSCQGTVFCVGRTRVSHEFPARPAAQPEEVHPLSVDLPVDPSGGCAFVTSTAAATSCAPARSARSSWVWVGPGSRAVHDAWLWPLGIGVRNRTAIGRRGPGRAGAFGPPRRDGFFTCPFTRPHLRPCHRAAEHREKAIAVAPIR